MCVCLLDSHSCVLPVTSGKSYTLSFAMLPVCSMFFLEWSRNSTQLRRSPLLLAKGCYLLHWFCFVGFFGFWFFGGVCIHYVFLHNCLGWKSYCKPRYKTGQQSDWSEGKESAVMHAYLQLFILPISNLWRNKLWIWWKRIVGQTKNKQCIFVFDSGVVKTQGFLILNIDLS